MRLASSIVADRSWRRGYYQTKRWDRKTPIKLDRVINRFDAQAAIGESALVVEAWERSAISNTRRLMSRREKWRRPLHAAAPALQADSFDSSSNSNGSSDCSDGSSRGSSDSDWKTGHEPLVTI